MDLQDCFEAIENNELDDLVDYEYDGIETILYLCEEILEYKARLEEVINNNK